MRTLSYLVAVCISTSALAGDLPNPKPGKAHEVLARDAGKWDCKVKMFFEGQAGTPTEFKGEETNTLVSGDLYLQTAFTCQMGERKFEGHSLMGYDPRSKKYVGVWADNFTPVPSPLTGAYDEKTKTLTVHSTLVDEHGNEHKQKQTTTWTGDSKKKFEIFLAVEADGQEEYFKLMEMTATKRK